MKQFALLILTWFVLSLAPTDVNAQDSILALHRLAYLVMTMNS